jgi:hypothetical protein
MYLTVHEKVHTPEMEHTCDRNLQREELGAVCDKKRDSTGNIEGLMDETLCNIINMSASPQKITALCLKFLLQNEHLYGFSPVCNRV